MAREQIDEWLDAMALTSICGLGQAAPVPVRSAFRTGRSCSGGSRVIEFTLDGERQRAPEGELLVHAAARNDVFIPTLCHDDKLDPYGGCRMCVVDVEGAPRPTARLRDPRLRGNGRLHEFECARSCGRR